jgi:uncharacterized BrkB/YihY/UPF0761 family membrane protein
MIPQLLYNVVLVVSLIVSAWAVARGFYCQAKWRNAKREERRAWGRSYRRAMATFFATWMVMLLLFLLTYYTGDAPK